MEGNVAALETSIVPATNRRATGAATDRARPLADIESELLELTGHLNAATYRWLVLLAEFDTRKGWHGFGIASLAHWLNWKCGIDIGAAREKVRVAHALPKLPRIAASMARGELSYSKVRALTRVACVDTEDTFLMLARHGTTAHVERLVRGYRRCADAESLTREARQQAARTVGWRIDEDGSYVIHAVLPAEAGARFTRSLDAAVEAMPAPGVSAETFLPGMVRDAAAGGGSGARRRPIPSTRTDGTPQSTWSARRADALAAMAETFAKHGLDPLAPGERHEVVVHVDAETLVTGEHGRCEVEDGPPLAVETARRLCCDGALVTMVERDGEPLDVGRRTRVIPPALRRALRERDRGCRFPGCTNQRFVDGHHIRHWARGGETKLSNLLLLCRYHHRLVHEGGFGVRRLDDGALRFSCPDGRVIDPAPTAETTAFAYAYAGGPASDSPLRSAHAERGLAITPTTARSSWRGERFDYSIAIEGLLSRARRGRVARSAPTDVSGETRPGG